MHTLSFQDGSTFKECFIEVEREGCPNFDSCYVLAFPKSGSVLLNAMSAVLMAETGVPCVDLPAQCFSRGIEIDTVSVDCDDFFKRSGYCYSGFRKIPARIAKEFTALPGKKVLMVRDPRDMLVSLYYSIKYSHRFPAEMTKQFFDKLEYFKRSADVDIDSFCVSNVPEYIDIATGYLTLLDSALVDSALVKIVRYEDIVFDKATLAHILCKWFSLEIESSKLERLVANFDVLPSNEQPLEHVRQVYPGDHKRKLSQETVEILNASFSPYFSRFNYAF